MTQQYEKTVIGEGRISNYALKLLQKALNNCGTAAGRIHSVFGHGFHFEFRDELIYAGEPGHGLCCFGMELPGSAASEIAALHSPGDTVMLSEGRITVYAPDAMHTILLSGFETVDLRIPPGKEGAPVYPAIGELCENASREAVFRTGNHNAVTDDVCREIYRETACFANDTAGMVDYLMGRGPGLTPSGDDILTGYGAALRAFAAESEADAFAGLIASRLGTGRTNAVSEAYFKAMAAGYANEVFIDMVKAISERDAEGAMRAALQMTEIGHTSGRDTLFSVCAALRSLRTADI